MATGEDLDDVATGIFMSYLDGDIDELRCRLPDVEQGIGQGEGYDSHHPAPAAHTRQGGQALCPPAWPLLLPGEGEERGDRRGEEKER